MLFLFLLKQNYFMDKFLIVGLGNPDKKYRNTRHNIGFEILDFICEKYESKFETERLGQIAKISVKGRKVLLLKPNTYMNQRLKRLISDFHFRKYPVLFQLIFYVQDECHQKFQR